MTQASHAHAAPEAGHRSAVARVTLLVEVADGTETVSYERRLTDASTAREWCEDKVAGSSESATVLEIQVTEEVWGLRHAWEATPSRHTPETVQLGLSVAGRSIAWTVPRAVGSDRGPRRL